jgi:threonine/homoserine/homoserine lactone efflux protein
VLKSLLIYFITLAVSYIATIPPGPLSIFVAHTTLQKNVKIALWVAIGGVLCEGTYAYLATEGILLFDKYPQIDFWINWAIVAILLIVGITTFFQKGNDVKDERVEVKSRFVSFLKGISLSLFNPALLPFWLVVLLEYKNHEFLAINSFTDKVFFVSGAGTGTFLLVYTYSFIAEKKRDIVFNYLSDNRLNKLIGGIFIGLALLKIVSISMEKYQPLA